MTVDVDDQIRTYALWLEQDIGIALSRSAPASSSPGRPRHSRLLTAAACAVAVLAGIAGLVLVATRPSDRPASSAVQLAPYWYSAVSRSIPDGFDHIAVLTSVDEYVAFEAFDPVTARRLIFTVSRQPMSPDPGGAMTLDRARSQTWTDPGDEYDISLPDGRKVGVFCSLIPNDRPPGCPEVNGVTTNAEDLRTFAISLATDVLVTDLPEPDKELGETSIVELRAATQSFNALSETGQVAADHYAFAYIQFGDIDSDQLVSVRTVTGFFPAFKQAGPRTSVVIDGQRATWQAIEPDTVWFVYDTPARGLDVAGQILDSATALADD